MDDPAKYGYKVQVLEEEKQPGFGKNNEKSKGKETNRQWGGSLMDVRCNTMRYIALHCHLSLYTELFLIAVTALHFLSQYFAASFGTASTATPQLHHHGP